MEEICKILAQQLKKSRQELKMTQKELAQASGLHRTYIIDLEKARANLSIKNLAKIARVLKKKPAGGIEIKMEHR